MDEESLTTAIEQYKQQFLQVQTVLLSAGEEGQEDLVRLRDDLVELIHVSEGSLLSLKKSKLLQLLEEQESSTATSKQPVVKQETPENDNDVGGDDDDDNITGTKCRVSFTQEWGVSEHHNAMLFRVETLPSQDESAELAKVRVLFLNPTHKSMVPCPYFMDGNCRFLEQECRFSHGYLVSVEELKPFKEPDFSGIHEGQKCLARFTDGVWYKSTIKSVDEDRHEFVVHYDTYNMADSTLPLDDVYPLRAQENGSDSDSLSSDSEESKVTNEDDDDVIRYAWKPTGGPLSLGDWEQHTRGIGSKLMTKMGYIFGKGLGKDGEGRVEPIEVVVLPQGKSLDKCAELREKKLLKEPFKRRRRKKATASGTHLSDEAKATDVFDFINNKLGHKKGRINDIRVPVPSSGTDELDLRKSRKSIKDEKDTNWNVQLFKIHEEIATVKKQLRHQEHALKRHTGSSSNNSFFKEKRDRVRTHLHQLQAKENMIQQKIHQKHQHKKLTVF